MYEMIIVHCMYLYMFINTVYDNMLYRVGGRLKISIFSLIILMAVPWLYLWKGDVSQNWLFRFFTDISSVSNLKHSLSANFLFKHILPNVQVLVDTYLMSSFGIESWQKKMMKLKTFWSDEIDWPAGIWGALCPYKYFRDEWVFFKLKGKGDLSQILERSSYLKALESLHSFQTNVCLI